MKGYKRRRNGVFPTKETPPYASMAYISARFWPSFEVELFCRKGMDTPCWRWTQRTDSKDYAIIVFSHTTLPQRYVRANRVALAYKLGKWPANDIHACHGCDFPACVNPLHIYPGDDVSNSADRARRGRVVTTRRPGVPPVNQVYTDEQMQRAIDLYFGPEGNGTAKRKHSIQSLARRFHVSEAVIRRSLRPNSKLSFSLSQDQRSEIKRLYFSADGQGSVCPAGSSQARWTTKAISEHLGIAKHSIDSAVLGDTFSKVVRPHWAQQYKGGVLTKREMKSTPDPKL